MSIDPSNGRIAIVWADDQGAGNCGSGAATFSGTTSNQVKLLRGTWSSIGSAPVEQVTPMGSPDTVFPSVAALNGKIALTYYTRDYAIGSAAPVCHFRTNDVPTAIPPMASVNSVCMDYAAKSGLSVGGLGSQVRLSTESSNPYVQFADGWFIGRPGEPSCMYHAEGAQEDFLVVSGECLLVVEVQDGS